MDEVLELRRVAHEEDRRVVTDQIEVPLFGIELHREPARVANGVGIALLAGHVREADEHRRALADLREEVRFRELGHVLGDFEEAVRAATLGVHDALGHTLAIEVLDLLDEVVIVQDGGTCWTDRQRVLVARGRDAGVGGRGGRLGRVVAVCRSAGIVGHEDSLSWIETAVIECAA